MARAGGVDIHGREKVVGCSIYIGGGGVRVREVHVWGSGSKSSTMLHVGVVATQTWARLGGEAGGWAQRATRELDRSTGQ
jgi:hypothetical protein